MQLRLATSWSFLGDVMFTPWQLRKMGRSPLHSKFGLYGGSPGEKKATIGEVNDQDTKLVI